MDRRTFITGEPHALRVLFGENSSGSASYKVAIASLCNRLTGVFVSLKVSTDWLAGPSFPYNMNFPQMGGLAT